MASPRDIRKLALLVLYQLDAQGSDDPSEIESIRDSLDDVQSLEEEGLSFSDQRSAFTERDRDRAFEMASGAYRHRAIADVELNELSNEWSVSRMPVVDRSILRLAHFEMSGGGGSEPKAAVNEAIELAKVFSTQNSPGFINGLLDKILKRVLSEHTDTPSANASSE